MKTYRDPDVVNESISDNGEVKYRHGGMALSKLYAAREAALSGLDSVTQDVAASLGKPAYWRLPGGHVQEGSSQLIAYCNNSGRDYLNANVFSPADKAKVSSMTDDDMYAELSADNPKITHTSSDWTAGETSPIRSVLGAYGLWALPTVPRAGAGSKTAGCVSWGKYRSASGSGKDNETDTVDKAAFKMHLALCVVLPVFRSPVSVAKVRAVLMDEAWLGETARDRAWRSEQGVEGRVLFFTAADGHQKLMESGTTRRYERGIQLYSTTSVDALVRKRLGA
jgi:hypothetical protein